LDIYSQGLEEAYTKVKKVLPQALPPIGNSRFVSYDFINGKPNIFYSYSYSISGGSTGVEYEIYFVCDPNKFQGEYCLKTQLRKVLIEKGYVAANDQVSKSESITNHKIRSALDQRLWFNQIELILRYTDRDNAQREISLRGQLYHRAYVPEDCNFYFGEGGK